MPPKATERTGQRYGRLIVLRRAPTPTGGRNAFWFCRCDCGNVTTAAAANLGKTKFSCGCFKSESAAATLRKGRYSYRHGQSGTTEHDTWWRMIERCENKKHKKYEIYGGRGIKVCKQWRESFEAFYKDMGKRPGPNFSIDRIDVNGNYEPSNCRWATRIEQGGNKRNNRIVAVDGIKLHLGGWCRILKVKPWKLYDLTKSYNGDPPSFPSMETAIQHLLHEQQRKHR